MYRNGKNVVVTFLLPFIMPFFRVAQLLPGIHLKKKEENIPLMLRKLIYFSIYLKYCNYCCIITVPLNIFEMILLYFVIIMGNFGYFREISNIKLK